MPRQQVPATGLEYYLICFNKDGGECPDNGGYLSHHVADIVRDRGRRITDVFLMSHGWKGDIPAAIDQYDRWSSAMAACEQDRKRVRERWPGFTPLLIGFHWPSLPWGDEKMADGSYAAEPVGGEEEFVRRWGDRIANSDAAGRALRLLFRAAQDDIEPDVLPSEVVDAYHTLEREARLGTDGVAGAPDSDREPLDRQLSYEDWRDTDQALSYAGGLMGGLLSPLRQLSFWTMKKRARLVGEARGDQLLRQLLDARDGMRIHLMGHSFGCIVTSGMLRGTAPEGSRYRPSSSSRGRCRSGRMPRSCRGSLARPDISVASSTAARSAADWSPPRPSSIARWACSTRKQPGSSGRRITEHQPPASSCQSTAPSERSVYRERVST